MEKPWKVIAAFIGVFVAGAVFGGFFTMGVGAQWLAKETPVSASKPNRVAPTQPSAQKNRPAAAGARPQLLQPPQIWQVPNLMRRYAERLDLSTDQKERIHPLIQRATEDYNRLRQNWFRETAILVQRLQQDIARELTPEQREKLHKIEERQRETMKKLEPGRRESKKAPGGSRAERRDGSETPPPNSSPAAPLSTESASSGSATAGNSTATSSSATVEPEKKE